MTAPPASTMRRRILVAEDDDAMRALVCDALVDQGYDVVEASSGVSALPWQNHDPQDDCIEFDVDAIVTDYCMPQVDGMEILAAARRGRRRVPVIVVSAFADADLRLLATMLGATAVLAKPFALADLIDAVQDALKEASGIDT